MQMQEDARRRTVMWPVYVALFLLGMFVLIFLIMFVGATDSGGGNVPEEELTAETYMDTVAALLNIAHPENAPSALEQNHCLECHRDGGIAPMFQEVVANADERRPPLVAPAYIYESIVFPYAYTVPGRHGIMPVLFEPPTQAEIERIVSGEETNDGVQALADILAYLLSDEIQ